MIRRRHRWHGAAALGVAPLLCAGALAAAGSGAPLAGASLSGSPSAVPVGTATAGVTPTAYVTNSQLNSVSVLEGAHASGTIADVGNGPVGIAAAPGGGRAYVADYGFNNDVAHTLTPIDLVTGKAGKPITVGTGPMAVALTPDGDTAVVTLEGTSSHPGHTAVVVNLVTGRVSAPIDVGLNPEAVAVAPDGQTAYAASLSSAKVTPIDLATAPPQAGAPIALPGTAPRAIAVAPDGHTAYVLDAEGATIIPIDLADDTPGTPTALGCSDAGSHGCTPTALAFTADGLKAYVAAAGSGDVEVVTLASMKVTGVLPAGGYPDAVGSGAGWLYVTNGAGNSASVFTAGKLKGTPATGMYPFGVAVVAGSGSATASTPFTVAPGSPVAGALALPAGPPAPFYGLPRPSSLPG